MSSDDIKDLSAVGGEIFPHVAGREDLEGHFWYQIRVVRLDLIATTAVLRGPQG